MSMKKWYIDMVFWSKRDITKEEMESIMKSVMRNHPFTKIKVREEKVEIEKPFIINIETGEEKYDY